MMWGVFANAYFGRSEQSYRVGTVCLNWWYNCKELARKGWKGLYVLLLCANNTNRTISLMWTAAVLVYFFHPRYGVELPHDNTNIAAIALSSMQQYCTYEDLRKRLTFFFFYKFQAFLRYRILTGHVVFSQHLPQLSWTPPLMLSLRRRSLLRHIVLDYLETKSAY